MKTKIFNEYVMAIVLVFLLTAISVNIYDMISFPVIKNWNYNQIQEINKTQSNFSFVVFGDNKNSVTTFNSLIKKVNKENVLFSIDDGDLAFDGEKEALHFFIKQIKNFNKPLLTVIGNHELIGNGRGNYYDMFGRFYYSFALNNSYFLILDDSNEKCIDSWQMNWLKNELQKSQDYRYRFVFMHVPLYDPRESNHTTYYGLENRSCARNLNNLFHRYNVTMVFASHVHGYFRGNWSNTPYIVTGGAGAELMGSDPKHYFYHYIKVSVSNKKVEYKVVRLKSPEFDILDRIGHTLVIYIYSFLIINFWDIVLVTAIAYLLIYHVIIKKEWLIWNYKKKLKIIKEELEKGK